MDQNIILLCGGESDERLVSMASAQAMALALELSQIWFINPEGLVYAIDFQELINHRHAFTKEFRPSSMPIFSSIEEALSSSKSASCTFLLALHGGSGEDGTIQGLLERLGRPFTGSDAHSSKIAFNKIATKEALAKTTIISSPHILISQGQAYEELSDFLQEHQEIIVKPICGGSSLGCFFIKDKEQIQPLLKNLAHAPERKFFAEKIIHGRELTIGVIESEKRDLKALPVTEVITAHNSHFDYENKYLASKVQEITPAFIDEKIAQAAQDIALCAHRSLSLYGYSRTDLILATDGIYYLETNTLPGLSQSSLVPKQLAAVHITLKDFLLTQIRLAKARATYKA
jgi:D-alanine-D-alanine ligase